MPEFESNMMIFSQGKLEHALCVNLEWQQRAGQERADQRIVHWLRLHPALGAFGEL